jgi:hypothetical protein
MSVYCKEQTLNYSAVLLNSLDIEEGCDMTQFSMTFTMATPSIVI